MKEALIIFVRKPEAGKVKTRLAASLGDEPALKIYIALLQHTLAITQPLPIDKFVFYADEIVEDDLWQQDKFFKSKQSSGNLGHRMISAFESIFAKGYDRVCIIGSDCYELSTDILKNAFKALGSNDVVVGPAVDGGYYLLGMNKFYKELFENKSWSSADLFLETTGAVQKLGLRLQQLIMLKDVDEASDIPEALLVLKN